MLKVDLDAGPSGDALNDWAERIAPANDLVVITGPPLANSIDAALLACACDGLVIVAESEITDRKALHIAAERARIAGCRTLGVVMHGTKDHLPKWIRRIVGDPAETHVRED
jgi:Mrp family chromosome partitioning ATPase